jgi:TrmH family RNA methyltransferase
VGRVTRITSRSNPLLARLRKLAGDGAGAAHRDRASRRRALVRSVAGAPRRASAARDRHRRGVARAAAAAASPRPPTRLRSSRRRPSRSVATLESPPPIAFLVPLPPPAEIDPVAPTVVLDRIQDPGNVGSVLRSAVSFGFTQAIPLAGTASLWSPKVVRAGMGAHFALRLVDSGGATSIAALAVPLFGTSSHAALAIADAVLPWPCAWAFGHEGQGLADDVVARCRAVVAIPQPGGGESLNVAAAAAVCMYDTARRRAG